MAGPSSQSIGRLINDPPQGGAWNMSVDQMLLEQAAAGDHTRLPVLRIYAWKPATLSIGYFQALADREKHSASLSCPVVRRATGGGAIVHDREITYSLVLPAREGSSDAVYALVHDSILDALRELGLSTAQKVKLPTSGLTLHRAASPSRQEPFLCFQRRNSGDLVLDRYKIAGSAQRRLPGALLQHGSILLAKSEHAPELPGIADLCLFPFEVQVFSDRWVAILASRLGVSLESSPLTDREKNRALEILRDRYDRPEWMGKR